MRKYSFVTIIILLLHTWCRAQDTCYLVISDDGDKSIKAIIKEIPSAFYSTADREQFLEKGLLQLYNEGLFTASYIVNQLHDDTLFVKYEKGEKIFWGQLNTNGIDPFILSEAGYKNKQYEGSVFHYDAIINLFENLLQAAENNGYPFATIRLRNIMWGDTSISADVDLVKNQLIYFDTIKVVGGLTIAKNYLAQYTGISAGGLYDEHLLAQLDARLKEIPFVSVVRSSTFEFEGNMVTPIVYLEEKQSNKFDFIVGVIPDENIARRVIITGDGRLDLQNVFNSGEIFNFHFSKLESTSKELQTHLLYPYLPQLPLGLEGSFNLFLKDSTYLERTSSAGLLYQLTGNNHVRAYVSFFNSVILNIDTGFVITNKTLPVALDLNERSYGLEWNYEHLNYRFNPRNGYAWKVSAALGNKTILKNNAITTLVDPAQPDYNFASLYDSIDLSAPSFNYQYDLQWFIPFLTRYTILLQARGAAMISSLLPENNLIRIGGNALLRGFDERSLPVSQYQIMTLECRYLLSQNSYASLFCDGGYTQNKSSGESISDFPVGFGAGVNFETKAGIFGLSYALGVSRQDPLSLKNTKIHFGYVNYF